MPSCECCWNDRRPGEPYADATKRHHDQNCVCMKNSPEGLKAQAGQYWFDGRDSRYSEQEWRDVLKRLDTDGGND